MKNAYKKLICGLLTLFTMLFASCGSAPTKEYLDFYETSSSATYEIRNAPDGYGSCTLNINRWDKYIDFHFVLESCSLMVTVYKNPKEPFYVWYRDTIGQIEKITTLEYTTSTEMSKISYVKVQSQKIESSDPRYNEIYLKAKQTYEDWLPVLNDVISQISGGKYLTLDVLG